jgi:hypothetical protein
MFAVFPEALEKFISSQYQLIPPFSWVPSINGYKNGTRIDGFEAFLCLIYVQFLMTPVALAVLLLRGIISGCLRPFLGSCNAVSWLLASMMSVVSLLEPGHINRNFNVGKAK